MRSPRVNCPVCGQETMVIEIDGKYEPDTNAGGGFVIAAQECACALTEAQEDSVLNEADRTLTADDFIPEPVYSWE